MNDHSIGLEVGRFGPVAGFELTAGLTVSATGCASIIRHNFGYAAARLEAMYIAYTYILDARSGIPAAHHDAWDALIPESYYE